jgi:hypothetical protein
MSWLNHSFVRRAIFCGWIITAMALLHLGTSAQDFQGSTQLAPFDEEMIHYSRARDDTVVTRLQKRIDSGDLKLSFDERTGYLAALLEACQISPASQMLVFSKTSFQRARISPDNPRALYFNDAVYIGWIPGSPLVEISATDPKLGSVFYTLAQTKIDRPKFVRNDQCLECHASAKTMGVPGSLVRSFVTSDDGGVDLFSGLQVNHRTPFAERWGGWYVTGAPPGMVHRGNLAGKAAFDRHESEPGYRGSIADLNSVCEVTQYPQASSDIAALLVLEHQTHMQNFIARLNFESTLHLAQYGHVRYLTSIIEALLRYLLFIEEAPLTTPVTEKSSFAKWFESQGPKDHQGRSLRQFDLRTRTFTYPCSYLIYSEAFDKLPLPIKTHLYGRLWEILSGGDKSVEYQKIPAETKQAIREILTATKTDLPAVWRQD